jgi:hypothetical protein
MDEQRFLRQQAQQFNLRAAYSAFKNDDARGSLLGTAR